MVQKQTSKGALACSTCLRCARRVVDILDPAVGGRKTTIDSGMQDTASVWQSRWVGDWRRMMEVQYEM